MTKHEIYEYMKTSSKKPLMPEELVKIMKVPEDETSEFLARLDALVDEGYLVRIKKGRLCAPEMVNMYVGYLQTTKQGYGFVCPVGDLTKTDIFIAASDMKSAIDGDLVIARYKANTRKGLEGEIKNIVRRNRTKFVCRFVQSRKFFFAIPVSKRILVNILIPEDKREGAQDGDSVVVEITDWELSLHGMIGGEVVERLGPIDNPKYDLMMILREFAFEEKFEENVLQEARDVGQEVEMSKLEKDRVDLTELNCFTIDGVDAKDFDDAVSLSKEEELYKLGVHIADVSYYVRPGSALDEEACNRTSSLYFPEAVIPMLPVQLSNGICSLNPKTLRRALSAFVWFDGKGEIKKYKLMRSVIESKARLNYAQVQRYYDGATAQEEDIPATVGPVLDQMLQLAHILSKKRVKRGSIDINVPEVEIEVNDQGEPVDVSFAQRAWSNRVIEEFMIAANEVVATHFQKKKMPGVYRIHASPVLQKLEFFANYMSAFGVSVQPGKLSNPREIQRIIRGIEGKPGEYSAHKILLRSMMKAQYDTENIGHYGLGSECYCHFTSPIRRYPDLMIHRVLSRTLENGPLSDSEKGELSDALSEIASHCNQIELKIDGAERDYISLKCAQFMEQYVGEQFVGTISSVCAFGFFVELDEFPIEGLIHVSNMDDDYYIYDEATLSFVGRSSRKVFRIGNKVTIQVAKVVVLDREIDFQLLEHEGRALGKKKKKKTDGQKGDGSKKPRRVKDISNNKKPYKKGKTKRKKHRRR